MRIAIIGAGVAGLSSYLFLDKHILSDKSSEHSINIYESHDISVNGGDSRDPHGEPLLMSKAIGAALGIGKNGLAVLQRIDDNGEVLRKIQSRGHAISKWKMKSARGWTIVDVPVTSSVDTNPPKKRPTADMVLIARYNIWETLRNEVLKRNPGAIVKKKLTKLQALVDGRVQLDFHDGSTDTADLVIGADGLRSFVRRTMFERSNDTEPQTWLDSMLSTSPKKRDYITPQFEGLVGLGGFVPAEALNQSGLERGSMNLTLGANGFVGYGYAGERPSFEEQKDGVEGDGKDVVVWWSTFSCADPNMFRTKEEKDNRKSTGDIETNFDKQAALSSLLDRHQSWHDPTIQSILKYVAETRTLEHTYPTYTTPELPT